jgi:hypothetical protein
VDDTITNPKPGNLWRHSDFLRLWSGQTLSVFGSIIGGTAMSFTAVLFLQATFRFCIQALNRILKSAQDSATRSFQARNRMKYEHIHLRILYHRTRIQVTSQLKNVKLETRAQPHPGSSMRRVPQLIQSPLEEAWLRA